MRKKSTLDIQTAPSTAENGEQSTIRIVIRDAKPPVLARFLQLLMRFICFALLVCVCAIGIPRLFGIHEYNVLTGSMTPTYPVGTLVFVQPKDPNSIRPGEVVTVVMDEQLTLVTHRVVANNYDQNTIITKGDANNSNDSPSRYENIVGVVCFSIPYVGEVVTYFTNDDSGRVVGIAILIGILALTFIAEAICSLLTRQKAHYSNARKVEKAQAKNAAASKAAAEGAGSGAAAEGTDDGGAGSEAAAEGEGGGVGVGSGVGAEDVQAVEDGGAAGGVGDSAGSEAAGVGGAAAMRAAAGIAGGAAAIGGAGVVEGAHSINAGNISGGVSGNDAAGGNSDNGAAAGGASCVDGVEYLWPTSSSDAVGSAEQSQLVQPSNSNDNAL